MRSLSAVDIARVTEAGHARDAVGRALAVLHVALPDASTDELARLTIGERDALLLRVRRATFGPHIDMRISCPTCRDDMGFAIGIDQVLLPAAARAEPLEVACGGWRVRCRLPDSRDLAATAGVRDRAAARLALLRRLIVSVASADGDGAGDGDGGAAFDAGLLAGPLGEAIAAALGEADPQADLRFELSCPNQQHRFVAVAPAPPVPVDGGNGVMAGAEELLAQVRRIEDTLVPVVGAAVEQRAGDQALALKMVQIIELLEQLDARLGGRRST